MKNLFYVLFFALIPFVSKATLIQPPATMSEFVSMTEHIVYGTVEGHMGGDQFINNFKVLDVIKGDLNIGENIRLKEYSSKSGNLFDIVYGDVNFEIGARYVLFLFQDNDGFYKPNLYALSVYKGLSLNGQEIYGHTNDLLGLCFSDSLNPDFTQAYELSDFLVTLKGEVAQFNSWNPENAGATNSFEKEKEKHSHSANRAPCPNTPPAHCTTLIGDPANLSTTACDFVTNGDGSINSGASSPASYASNTWTVCVAGMDANNDGDLEDVGDTGGDPSTTGEIADLMAAVSTMNTMPGVNISFTGITTCANNCPSGGAAGDASSCSGADPNKMWVFFDDPCDQIADLSGCAGVLGVGGHFASSSCHTDDCGNMWLNASNPYFIMNNGSGCESNYGYTAVLIHEMLHSIGIGHIGTGMDCSALMNPILCNANEGNNAPDFGITSLDNECTDWMYNISSTSTCAISNVAVANAMCTGGNLTFEVTFDVVDGSGTYDIEVDGVNVFTGTAATAGTGESITVTIPSPFVGGTVTVTVRDDATFSCAGDAVNVVLPNCLCASTCADVATNDCGNVQFPDLNTYPGNTTNMTVDGGDGSGCQNFNALGGLPIDGGQSYTFCTEFTATEFTHLFFPVPISNAGSCSATETIAIFDNTCTDITATSGVTQPDGIFVGFASGLAIGDTYTVCNTLDYSMPIMVNDNGTPDTGDDFTEACIPNAGDVLLEYCMDIVAFIPSCNVPDAAIAETTLCSGAPFTVQLGVNGLCDNTVNPTVPNFWVIYDTDPSTIPTLAELQDAIFGNSGGTLDPGDISFFGEESAGCDGTALTDLLGFNNTTCDPLEIGIYLLEGDLGANSANPNCFTFIDNITWLPEVQTPTFDLGTCSYTFTGVCPNDIITISGGSTDPTPGNIVTYTPLEGDAAVTISIDVTNNTLDGGGVACPSSQFTFDISAFEQATIVCPQGPFCDDDNANYAVTGTPTPTIGEFATGSITVNLTGYDFGGNCGDQIVVFDATGAVAGVYDLTNFDNSMPMFSDILLSTGIDPVGTYTVGSTANTSQINVAFFSGCAIGMQGLTCGGGSGGTIDGSYTVDDSAANNFGPFTPVGDGMCAGGGVTTLEDFFITIAVENITTVSTNGVFAGLGTNVDDMADPGGPDLNGDSPSNNDGTPDSVPDWGDGVTDFNPATAGAGEHEITYTYTDDIGCVSTASCFVDVYAYPTLVAGTPTCNLDGTYNVDITVGGVSTGWNEVLDGTTAGTDGVVDGTATSFSISATAGTPSVATVNADGSISITNITADTDIMVTISGSSGCDVTVPVVAPSCVTCPDLTVSPAPAIIISSESSCEADNTTLSGGVIAAPTDVCPIGSTLLYSTDGGLNYSTSLPVYDQSTAITVTTICECDIDQNEVSATTIVSTVPGICPTCDASLPSLTAPAAVVSSESSCEADNMTLSGGVISIPATACPSGSTIMYSVDGGTTYTSTLPIYDQMTAITVMTICECDIDENVISLTNTVTTVPGICPTICDAIAPVISNDGGDCPDDNDGSGDNTPFTFTEDGSDNTVSPYITEYIALDGPNGNILGVFATLSDAADAANIEAMTNGDACIQAINHNVDEFMVISGELTGCVLASLPQGSLMALWGLIQVAAPGTSATIADIEGFINFGNGGISDLTALGGSDMCAISPFCYALSNVDCITLESCIVETITISDPCICNNDSATNDPHTFDETVTVSGPAGATWTVVSSSGTNGAGAGATLSETSSGVYEITFSHNDGVGYLMEVSDGTNTLFASNVCQYPNASFTVDASYCMADDTDYDLTTLVMENSVPLQAGTVIMVMVDGVATTMFNPNTLGIGSYPIMAQYDGSGTGGDGTAAGNATDAYSGDTNNGQAVMPVPSSCIDQIVGTLNVIDCTQCNADHGTISIKAVPSGN